MTRAEMNWKIFRSVLPLAALIAFAYYTKSMKVDYVAQDPVLVTDSHDLFWRFQMNEGSELINKIIQFDGKISGFDESLIIIDKKLICTPDTTQKINSAIGDSIILKGRCIGYDDLMKELRLDHVVQVTD